MPHIADSLSQEELNAARIFFQNEKKAMNTSMKGDDEKNIDLAFEMALNAHRFQKRKSGEPYIYHPIMVAKICFEEMGLGPTAIIGALLHDTIEDTDLEFKDIQKAFGPKIATIVEGLTKIDGLHNKANSKAETLRKIFSAMIKDVRVVLIKIADRLHNMRTLGSMPSHKQVMIAGETQSIYTPLCHKLGLYNIKTELEDICMSILQKDDYEAIGNQLEASSKRRDEYINEFTAPIEKELHELGLKYSVKGRMKAISSISQKLQKKKVNLDQIFDLFAVRFIIDVPKKDEIRECWNLYSIIANIYRPIPERLKDWITVPKGNGYESLHTTVMGPSGKFVEVQIRTERMDDIAERGFAAHWKYKGVKDDVSVYDNFLNTIRTILEDPDTNALEFLFDLQTSLTENEIYVFTPKGEIKTLPQGATALDFAFDIHTEIGYSAHAIKVNNKIVPMGTPLQSGDQIEVDINKSQKPSETWLKWVITGKARSKIRSALKEAQKLIADQGKEIMERKLKNLKLDFESNADNIYKHFGFKSRTELYVAISKQEINLLKLKPFIGENNILDFAIHKKKLKEFTTEPEYIPKPKEVLKDLSAKILINGESFEKYQYTYATCCNPQPGDDVFAYMTAGSGMKIHKKSCNNATHLFNKYDYRILDATWEGQKLTKYPVEIKITGIDQDGVLVDITNLLTNKLKVPITKITIEGHEKAYEGCVTIIVKDKKELTFIINELKLLSHVFDVERIF